MEQEILRIFNEQHEPIGTATRAEVHRLGLWHETFHCWIVSKKDGVDYIYLQQRSYHKKDYPNLLDISAAGHLLASETVVDGVREVKEELGIQVSVGELDSLGKVYYCMIKPDMIDKEIANVYLYRAKHSFDDYRLQPEEVSGIVRTTLNEFRELWLAGREQFVGEGFEIDRDGNKRWIHKNFYKYDLVQHEGSYYRSIIDLIDGVIRRE